jgi:uncharacterized protein YicC (UPF0701 family)
MRAAGMSCQQICDREPTLKTASNVAQDIQRALAAISRQRRTEGDPLTLELERLAVLERTAQTVMRNAATGKNASPNTVLNAIDRLTRLSERRASLLGLGAARWTPPAAGAPNDFDEVAAQRRKRRAAQGW